LQLTLGRVVECIGDHVRLLDDLPNGATLAQKIFMSSVFPVTETIVIEDHKLNNTFLHVTFGSQSLVKPTGDQTGSDTNWRTGEGDQRGVNGSRSKFLNGIWPISWNDPTLISYNSA
jgi:hypothetical protein